ncbi:uncharacterized protein UV8b_04078 [Ustilaginoidea virens]|uniref:Uncharacterized protein n=1 Tax=Ustilaginoidea virens TaxID=1159556 RepID=A0A8E5MHQ6_USTVR|nr:uncharacterized protein UV8b_04078 [Ustilaginoidea virens]QUC19837.1 hypothetical protein UV8b_04078 [Ustilaginoidea virens]
MFCNSASSDAANHVVRFVALPLHDVDVDMARPTSAFLGASTGRSDDLRACYLPRPKLIKVGT